MLPEKGIMFLGGHINMTKKLKQKYPKWAYVSDENIRKNCCNVKIIFYWTAHGSHKLMRKVYSKIPSDTQIIYVSSTNIDYLEREMHEKLLLAG